VLYLRVIFVRSYGWSLNGLKQYYVKRTSNELKSNKQENRKIIVADFT
jgi:hypothetical protein